MSPRDLAYRAFWSTHPLCDLFVIANGQWIGRQFVPASSFSLRQLIEFTEQLPPHVITNLNDLSSCLTGRNGER